MIELYSGTPGSGKSFHMAKNILIRLKYNFCTLGNFPINNYKKYKRGQYIYVDNTTLTPQYLKDFSREYFKTHKFKEGAILLFIDEAQLLFNSREFQRSDRMEWLSFFSQHRHFGYDIILCCQFDRMLDRQIRSLIEFEHKHRKVSNLGWKGFLISFWCVGRLVCSVRMWYPLKQKIDSQFFVLNKNVFKLYDSYMDFA